MEKTQVVCLKIKSGKILQSCDEYIGKQVSKGGWKLSRSIFYNPYIPNSFILNKKNGKLTEIGGVEASIKKYWDMLIDGECDFFTQQQIYLIRNLIPTLKGKKLGCWCKRNGDELCHGDVLAWLCDYWNGEMDGDKLKIDYDELKKTNFKLYFAVKK